MFGVHRLVVLASHRTIAPILCTVVLLASATSAAGQSALRSVGVATVGGEAVVTVEATGPLPSPTLGALDGPPRIFLDFANVRLAAQGLTRTSDPRIRRVRVGTFSVDPLVTRVVIDLVTLLPHRIEVATGRVMVFIGSSASPAPITPPAAVREPASGVRPTGIAVPDNATPPKTVTPTPEPRPSSANAAPRPESTSPPTGMTGGIPPVPSLPPPTPDGAATPSAPRVPPSPSSESSGTRLPYRPPTAPPPSRDLEKYRGELGTLLERLKLQMPLLELMQSLDEDFGGRMPAAIQEFDRLRDELVGIKPPDTLRTQHDLLVQATRLAGTAARLRLESVQTGNTAARRNAASAAAGATLMLDRAFVEVGFAQDGR